MPLRVRRRESVYILEDGEQLSGVTLELKGRIEADTIDKLQKELHPLMEEKGQQVFLNMRAVEYSTSTGMGVMLQAGKRLGQQGGRLSLLAPAPDLVQVMEIIGVQEFLAIFSDEKDLCARYRITEEVQTTVEPTDQQDLVMQRAKASASALSQSKTQVSSQGVVLAASQKSIFFDLLTDELRKNGVATAFTSNAKDAWRYVRGGKASVLMVDYDLQGYEELCMGVKSTSETSACSIVRVYPEGQKPGTDQHFSVIPNQYVSEPCSVSDISTFVLSEVQRHRSESSTIQHEFFSVLTSDPEEVAKAVDHLGGIVARVAELEGRRGSQYVAAVREALDNARRHGHLEDINKGIRLLYLRDSEKITVVVRDGGGGFDPAPYLSSKADAGTMANERPLDQPGGLGIALMKGATDAITYNEVGNEVSLTLNL